jgi:hypothetical protein
MVWIYFSPLLTPRENARPRYRRTLPNIPSQQPVLALDTPFPRILKSRASITTTRQVAPRHTPSQPTERFETMNRLTLNAITTNGARPDPPFSDSSIAQVKPNGSTNFLHSHLTDHFNTHDSTFSRLPRTGTSHSAAATSGLSSFAWRPRVTHHNTDQSDI